MKAVPEVFMALHRHAVSAVALLVVGAVYSPGEAQAGVNVFWRFKVVDVTGSSQMRITVVDDDPTNEVASVELRVSSDAGDEDLLLTESDAWLHGAAALSALPAEDAALTLTLYDKGSVALTTYSGSLATDGTVALGEGESTGCEILTKLGCEAVVEYDLEVLAAEIYPSAKGYALTLDLAGADTYEVAYATVEVAGGDNAEVDWDGVGSVWTGESTLEHRGVVDVKAKSLDAESNTIENVHAELAEPWHDDGEGVSALSVGSGTSVAVSRWGGDQDEGKQPGTWSGSRDMMTVVSAGWTTTEYPTHAALEVAGGDTVSVPANSYQRFTADFVISDDSLSLVHDTSISINGTFQDAVGPSDLRSPHCSSGTCVVLLESEEGYELSFTVYGPDPAKLPEKQDFDVVFYDKEGSKVGSETISVAFDAEVTAVFATKLEIDGDPVGGDASGSVSLLGAPDTKGKQDALSKGTFYASFARDSDGDLALGGYGPDERATSDTSAGAVLGDPVECGGAGCDGDWAPPVVVYRPSWTLGGIRAVKIPASASDGR